MGMDGETPPRTILSRRLGRLASLRLRCLDLLTAIRSVDMGLWSGLRGLPPNNNLPLRHCQNSHAITGNQNVICYVRGATFGSGLMWTSGPIFKFQINVIPCDALYPTDSSSRCYCRPMFILASICSCIYRTFAYSYKDRL